ncbi:MAG: phosphatidate cytidylyltransferase [Actinomycetota bacterium]
MTRAPDEAQPPEGTPPTAPRRRRLLKRAEVDARVHDLEDDFRNQVAATRAQIDATQERIQARTGRNLPVAILIGLGLGGGLLASLLIAKVFFMVFAALLIGFTAYELASALRFAGRDVPRVATIVAGIAVVPAAFYWGPIGAWFVTLAGMAFVSLWRTADLIRPSHRVSVVAFWKDIGAGVLVQVYVPFLAMFTLLLDREQNGEFWVLAFLIVVVATDTGAYVSGMLFGKHPMAPKISPKKTWEGFAGSVVVAIVAGILLVIFMLHLPWWFGIIFGATMVFTGTVGDLTESLIKRDLGIKDISTFLPGHGGFLDRLDSTLPSAAAAFLLYLVFSGLAS